MDKKLIGFTFIIVTLITSIKLFNFENSDTQQTEVYLFTNPDNVGDRNQILGIDKELKKMLSIKNSSKEININSESELYQATSSINNSINNGQKVAVITSGEYGINLIEKFPPNCNLITTHSSHQLTPKHEKILGIVKIIALPKHAIDEKFKKKIKNSSTVLVETTGVAHNLSKDELEEEANKIQNIIPNNKKFVAVILGGDAPRPDGKMLYYSEESAQKLAKYLSEKIKTNDLHLLILNGPRTGKFDTLTREVNTKAHKDGNLDLVTKAFVEELQNCDLEEGKNFTLLDFQFGKPSYYKSVLGTVLKNNGEIFVPGESTSMISECIDNLPGSVTIYLHEAMNETHKAHTESEYAASRANILDQHMHLRVKAEKNNTCNTESACQRIANTIKNLEN